jgi:hypothetical protein
MYRSNREVWMGFRKNAIEGLGSPRLIIPATLILTIGQIAPFGLVLMTAGAARIASLAALACAYLARVLAARRFHQPVLGALLHPLGIFLLLTIQWQAFFGWLLGSRVEWKGRTYAPPKTQPH